MYRESLDTLYIREVLTTEDFDKVWLLLEEKFSMNVAAWKESFEKAARTRGRFTSREEAFLLFGKQKIEPLLNDLLFRRRVPTWIYLLRYVLRDKLKARELRATKYQGRLR
ncbi:hypothetical protein WBG78_22245 [Chryseolinea sp. T2]|uniref:hypothetical protein n=1 Tax=Chryseolinea sp. T2 TaxID=3129255 RepID=UPI00307849E7